MQKKFEVNWTKIKRGCQSYTKAAPRESWSDFTLVSILITNIRHNNKNHKNENYLKINYVFILIIEISFR